MHLCVDLRLCGNYSVHQAVIHDFCNITISKGIPTASPFCKGGLRGIFLIQAGVIENLLILLINSYFLELKYMETDEHFDAPSCTYAYLGIKTYECRP